MTPETFGTFIMANWRGLVTIKVPDGNAVCSRAFQA